MAKGLYKSKLPSGAEIAYVEKENGKTLGVMRDRYEEQGYEPLYDDLPEK